MSRIGILPVIIPSGVTADIAQDDVTIKGTGGELLVTILPDVTVEQAASGLIVKRRHEERSALSQHGLMRTLLANAVHGVSEGFSKTLEINGVGFRAQVNSGSVVLNLGYSHPNELKLPAGVSAALDGNRLTLSGIDKQLVGQVAADIRALRPPEPYKGKGIKYADERIVRKAGKAAGAGK